jgi:hypothetical protein
LPNLSTCYFFMRPLKSKLWSSPSWLFHNISVFPKLLLIKLLPCSLLLHDTFPDLVSLSTSFYFKISSELLFVYCACAHFSAPHINIGL